MNDISLIYKYMKLEYINDAIQHDVYASKLEEVNGPYEFEGIKHPEKFRICIMTNSLRTMLMWSHYGVVT